MPRIDRSAFLYLPPKGDKGEFAQCLTCIHFITPGLCGIFTAADKIEGEATCGLYLHGEPIDSEPRGIVTPAQAGYLAGSVRCENCSWFANGCGLYRELNETMPDAFALNADVDAHGCCNAFQSQSAARKDSFTAEMPASLIDDIARKDDAGDFKESEHQRDGDGKFTSGGGGQGSGRTLKPTSIAGGKRLTASGDPLPKHIASLKIPPAWIDVHYSEDPDSSLLATGRDSKGRTVSVYSKAHAARQAEVKYARIHELNAKFDRIKAQNDAARKDPERREAADCLDLIMQTGIRPGGEGDTGAEKQAYGATTLQGRHVRVTPTGKVSLQFIGKKGVALNIPVDDPDLAKRLIRRKEKAGATGKLFDTTAGKLLAHTHSLDGGGFKTKDFRTHLGTTTAAKLVSQRDAPADEKSYRRAVMAVAKDVAAKLGNTATIALQSYINPAVFASWRIAA
jgi:DNA topoisomerase-1